jgi:hypothetical protein
MLFYLQKNPWHLVRWSTVMELTLCCFKCSLTFQPSLVDSKIKSECCNAAKMTVNLYIHLQYLIILFKNNTFYLEDSNNNAIFHIE